MDREIINNIKSLAIDMIENSSNGYPGYVLSSAPIIYTLYSKFMNISTNDDNWIGRDRFILSSAYASPALYSCLFMSGFNLTINDLKNFGRINSKTPGFPEFGTTAGIDATTGPFGDGLGIGVGMALAQKNFKKRFFFPKKNVLEVETALFDYDIYVLCNNEDLMNGISYEAASFAGSNHLDNIIVLYDSSNMYLDGKTKYVFEDNIDQRFKSMGWAYEYVKNGDNVSEIEKAIRKAKNSSKPTIIEIKTVYGNGLSGQGTIDVNKVPIKKEDLYKLKVSLGLNDTEPFYYSEKSRNDMIKMVTERSSQKYSTWSNNYRNYIDRNFNGDSTFFNFLFNHNTQMNLIDTDFHFENDLKESLFDTNLKIMNEICKNIPNFIGGSSGYGNYNKTKLNQNDITYEDYNGKNVNFGMRENLIGSACNGLSLSGIRSFATTTLSSADNLKQSIRMSAIMKEPVAYIFSHDSIGVGHEGKTFEPVEQIAMLRNIPNLRVYRPADAHELVGCWHNIINENKMPSALILSKQEMFMLPTTYASMISRGGYIIRQEQEKLDGIIVATGSDVITAISLARYFFVNKNIDLRIVSMPEVNLFLEQPIEYQQSVLPQSVKTFTIEAGNDNVWYKFATSKEYIFSVNSFGASGTREEVNRYCGFDFDTIKNRMETLL